MTKSFWLAFCALLVVLVLGEEEPQKGGAEQLPGETLKNKRQSDEFSSFFSDTLYRL